MMDYTTRLFNGLLRNVTNSTVNLRFGTQIFEHTPLSSLDVLVRTISILMTIILVFLGSFGLMSKLGSHFVLDRQSGFRRQMFLNGVNNMQYWCVNIVYCFMMQFVVQTLLMLAGIYIFRIDNLVRIDGWMIVILIFVQTLVSVSVALFIASLVKQVAIYNLINVLVLLISLIPVFMSLGATDVSVPFYSYFFPTIGYCYIILSASQYGIAASDLFRFNIGSLLVWTVCYCFLLLIVGYLVDEFSPLNDFTPTKLKFLQKLKA